MAVQKKGLGRGLSALISDVDEEDIIINDIDEKDVIEIDINKIEPNKEQPRKKFDEQTLKELADSIRLYGVIQPVIVRKKDDYYELIAGERRWRAARIAGISKIPIIIKNYAKQEILEISLVENVQREDLNPMEEAESYNKLVKGFGLTQEQVSEKLGKSRSVIANSLRLLNLDTRVQKFVMENKITNGHARALLSLDNFSLQFDVAERIIKEDLSVRQTETIVKSLQEKGVVIKKEKIKEKEDNIYKGIEKEFSEILGTKVQILNGKKKGKIEIEYYSSDDLDRLLMLVKEIER